MMKKLSTITREEEEKAIEESRLGAIKMLNCIIKYDKKRIIFVNVKIVVTPMTTLIDTRATNIFIYK